MSPRQSVSEKLTDCRAKLRTLEHRRLGLLPGVYVIDAEGYTEPYEEQVEEARAHARVRDENFPHLAPHRVVRLASVEDLT